MHFSPKYLNYFDAISQLHYQRFIIDVINPLYFEIYWCHWSISPRYSDVNRPLHFSQKYFNVIDPLHFSHEYFNVICSLQFSHEYFNNMDPSHLPHNISTSLLQNEIVTPIEVDLSPWFSMKQITSLSTYLPLMKVPVVTHLAYCSLTTFPIYIPYVR